MKKQLLALVGLGLLLATASASAQTVRLKANIPFNFIVNKAELPAGEYTLQSLGSSDTAMLIQSTDSQIAKMVLPNACASSKPQRSEQAGVPPLRLRVLPGPDLDGRIRAGQGTAKEQP